MTNRHRLLIGAGVSALFLAAFLYKVDYGEVGRALGDARYLFLVPAVLLDFLGVWFRTVRWRVLLGHLRGGLRIGTLYRIVVVGYAANNLVPLRLGEVARAYYLSRKTGISGPSGLATIVVERVTDGVALLVLAAGAALFIPLAGTLDGLADGIHVPTGLLVAAATLPFVIALGFLVLLAAAPARVPRVAGACLRIAPRRLRAPVLGLVERFVLGLAALRNPRQVALVLALTLPVWLAEGAMYLSVAYAFGIPETLGSWRAVVGMVLLLTAVSNLATAIPAAQGSVGTFHFFTAATVVAMGAGLDTARAYAITLHIAMYIPATTVGLLILWADNVSLWQLLRDSKKRAPARADAPTAPAPPLLSSPGETVAQPRQGG